MIMKVYANKWMSQHLCLHTRTKWENADAENRIVPLKKENPGRKNISENINRNAVLWTYNKTDIMSYISLEECSHRI